MKARLAAVALAAALTAPPAALGVAQDSGTDVTTSTVGMPAVIRDLVLPAPELEAAPRKPEDPVVVRVLATYPHGTEFRYDLEFWGQEPGEHDLAAYLRPKPGTGNTAGGAPVALPPIPVEVRTLLPPGQVEPHAPVRGDVPGIGGYRALLTLGGIMWFFGLLAILLVGRTRRREEAERAARPLTLAERLRPLVERALADELTRAERARLELGLVAFWRRKLDLEEAAPSAVLAKMREHPEAGPLLTNLERWLHDPASDRDVDLTALLAPYRDLPADAIDLPPARTEAEAV